MFRDSGRPFFKRFFGITLCVALTACSSIGPSTMDRDHMDYGRSVGENWKNQANTATAGRPSRVNRSRPRASKGESATRISTTCRITQQATRKTTQARATLRRLSSRRNVPHDWNASLMTFVASLLALDLSKPYG